MSNTPDPVSEDEALSHVVTRLAERFPDRGAQDLHDLVVEEYGKFDSAHVRDFVPVLVERAVVDRVRHPDVTA